MSTIEEQIKLEDESILSGINRYNKGVREAQERGQGSSTGYAQKLIGGVLQHLVPILDEYKHKKTPGKRAKYRGLLVDIDSDKALYIALKVVFDKITGDCPVFTMANSIGTAIHDELKFSKFHEEHPKYYEQVIKSFKERNTTNYRHRHRVLTFKAKEYEVSWIDWSREEIVQVGMKLLDIILEHTDLLECTTIKLKKNKTQRVLNPTKQTLEWINNYNAYASTLLPYKLPCIVKPDDWVNQTDGGYLTPKLRSKTPLVKTDSKLQIDLLKDGIDSVLKAVNKLQSVEWEVNKQVLEIMEWAWNNNHPIGFPRTEPYIIPESPIPKDIKYENMSPEQQSQFKDWKNEARILYTKERERVSKCIAAAKCIRLAKRFAEYDRFWFVWQADFRGRLYASTTGLSPQGSDISKSLLQFKNGDPVTEGSIKWLFIHGANTYGMDKLPFSGRIQWVKDNHDIITRCGRDPKSETQFWAGAENPWQFLAFCFEYVRYLDSPDSFVSHLPVALDGSCNGLQNFSALLRDSIGASATNLSPSDTPSDIYAIVGDTCNRAFRTSSDTRHVQLWIAYLESLGLDTIPRSLAKRPVMTLPYGVTKHTSKQYVYDFMLENNPDFWKDHKMYAAAEFMNGYLWSAITSTVVAASEAMEWLQECAGIISRAGKPLVWWTPTGFPVVQARMHTKSRRILTELLGRFEVQCIENTPKINTKAQKLGVSPNFIHSMDASHMTIMLNKLDNIQNISCIHDSFGTTAKYTDELARIIRESFVELYNDFKPLEYFKDMMEQAYGVTLPPTPKSGDFDLNQVLDSVYFFS